MTDRRWSFVVLASAFVVGFLVLFPNVIHMMDARFQGIPIHLNTDEHAYLQRLQEALDGPFGQAGKGIVESQQDQPGLVLAPIEEVEGILFGWTGLRAAWVFVILDFIIPALLFLAVYAFTRSLGVQREMALFVAAVFCAVELYNLGRPVNQGTSFLIVVVCLWMMREGVRGKTLPAVVAGFLMGALFAIYLWSWMTVWCVWGVLLFYFIAAMGPRAIHDRVMQRTLLAGGVGILAMVPSILRMFSLRAYPAYADAVARSGVRHFRWPESWPWTICALVMALGSTVLWWQRGRRTEDAWFPALAVSGFILFNQHMLHGIEILYRNHFLMLMALVALLIIAFVARDRTKHTSALIAFCGAVLILAASAFEARYIVKQWRIEPGQYDEQYLASLLPVLDELPQGTILTDPETSAFVVSHTKHYVIYTTYLFQSSLLSNNDLAERYCMTVLPYGQNARPDPNILNPLIELDTEIREREYAEEAALIADACDRVGKELQKFLQAYNAKYVLRDERRQPGWDPQTYGVPLTKRIEGEGWSLWDINLH